jgi:cell wall-associated NlpC family hydrolase
LSAPLHHEPARIAGLFSFWSSHAHTISPRNAPFSEPWILEHAVNGRALMAAIAAPIAVLLTLIGGFAMMFGGGGAAACTIPAAGTSLAPSTATATSSASSTSDPGPGLTAPSHPFSLPSSASPTSSALSATFSAVGVPGFDQEQVANAAVVVTTGAQLGVPVRGWIIAVATAIQESGLRNLRHGDTTGPDSLGLFQQRDGWGSSATRLDPVKSSRMFYLGGTAGQDGLLDIPGWQTLPLTQAAQAVQHSAHPDAYAAHEVEATTLVAATLTAQACLAAIPGAGIAARTAIDYARAQIGLPYQWGGNGPPGDAGFDCSGLTRAAYAAAGIHLPRTAQQQYDAGSRLPADLAPGAGDLVFFGADVNHITHVGLVVASGFMIDAPHAGGVVREERIWAGPAGFTRPSR